MDDEHIHEVMNLKKILVVPIEFLNRWKPDLSN